MKSYDFLSIFLSMCPPWVYTCLSRFPSIYGNLLKMCSPQKSPLNFSSWIFSVSIVSQTVTFAPGSSGLFFVFQCLGSCLPCGQSALEEFQVRQKKITMYIGEGRRVPLHKFSKDTPARPNKHSSSGTRSSLLALRPDSHTQTVCCCPWDHRTATLREWRG